MQQSSEETKTLNHNLTLILIKPDMEKHQLTNELLSRLKSNALEILYQGVIQFNLELVRLFYQWNVIIHPKEIGEYLCSRAMNFLVVRGNNAIPKTCTIKQELRKLFSNNDLIHNLMHCSDSPKEFRNEYELVLKHQIKKEKKLCQK